MSFARMHAHNQPSARKSYLTGLLETIEHYIQRQSLKKEQSTGIDRAKVIKNSLVSRLSMIEGLSEQQMLWRIYDYLFLPQGAYPLGTSKELRKAMLVNLCDYLIITKQDLDEKEECLLKKELQSNSECGLLSGFYSPDRATIHKLALQALITEALTRKGNLSEACEQSNFVEKLRPIFAECKALKHYKHIQDQWLGVEGLNEHQLLCRLNEHIHMSLTTNAGMFGGSGRLRASVALFICQHLSVNESVIRRELFESFGGRFYVSSPFGPIYNNHNPDRVMIDLRVQHINTVLKLHTSTHYVAEPFDKGQAIEMQIICGK